MPTIRHTLFYIAVAVVAAGIPDSCYARCNLPAPDGGITSPSKPNAEGRILSINRDTVVISANKATSKASFRIAKNTALHTAFGGVVDISEIKIDQYASVWFVGCKQSGKSAPVAAYLQIFSTDPNDQP